MDDAAFNRWSDTLSELRNSRQTQISSRIQDRETPFSVDEFLSMAKSSFDDVMETWFNFEQEFLESNGTNEPSMGSIRSEMRTTMELETDAVNRDISYARSQIGWDEKEMASLESGFRAFLVEEESKFNLKIKNLLSDKKKAKVVEEPRPTPTSKQTIAVNYGGSPMGLFLMFLLGLLLGGGPAIYFWDLSKNSADRFRQEKEKYLSDIKALQENMIVLQGSFYNLANGKIKILPELQNDIKRVRESYANQKKELEKEFERKRENVLRKVSLDRLDDALDRLESEKIDQLEVLNKQERARLDPLLKQEQTLQELMGISQPK